MLLGDAVTSCLIAAVFGSCAILGLRFLFYVVFYERIRLYLRRRGPGYEMYTPVVTEELWEGLGSLLLLALGSWLIFTHPHHTNTPHLAAADGAARCTPADTRGCLPAGWRPHAHAHAHDALSLLQLAWYSHCSGKAWFGLGRVQGADAALHHLCTLALLALCYGLRLLRLGLLGHWLFTAANPLLAASKLAHCLDARPPGLKKAVLAAFAAAYFATRVVLVPAVLLPLTLGLSGGGRAGGGGGRAGGGGAAAAAAAADAGADAGAALALANGLLLLLYGLSLFWFGRLLGMLVRGRLDAAPRKVVTAAEVRRWQKQQ